MKSVGFYILIFSLIIASCKKDVKPTTELLETKYKSKFKNALILGNSITVHPKAPEIGWHGEWGMAASSPEKDFVHILSYNFKKANLSSKVTSENIADFEHIYWEYDFSKLDSLNNLTPDLLILRIGENVDESTLEARNFYDSYSQLIHYFVLKNPGINIICVSSFWKKEKVEAVI